MRWMLGATLGLVFFLCAGLMDSGRAGIIDVPGDYNTIQEAADAAGVGDTIMVWPGVYEEGVYLPQPVTLISAAGPDNTTMQYAGGMYDEGVWIDGHPGELYRVEGFTISGFITAISAVGALYPTLEVIDCTITGSSGDGISGDCVHLTVRGCQFLDNGMVGIMLGEVGCALVEYNLFKGNGGAALGFYGYDYAGCPIVEVSHNTMVGNGLGVSTVSDDGISLHSNIIVENTFAGVWCRETAFGGGTGFVIEYNDVWASGENYLGNCADQTGINGNIGEDPLFCNPLAGDYSLAENSPCVGTGMSGTNMGAFDVGCGSETLVTDDEMSWGIIKALYR